MNVILLVIISFAVGINCGPNIKSGDTNIDAKYKEFVNNYVENEHLRKNSYLKRIEYELFFENDRVGPPDCYDSRTRSYTYWLPGTSCFGLPLPTNETVVLQCTNSTENRAQPGCFEVLNHKKATSTEVCIKILEDSCVGITTSMNITIALACYPANNCPIGVHEHLKNNYKIRNPNKNEFYFEIGDCYQVYNPEEEVNGYSCTKKSISHKYSCLKWIRSENRTCLGITTPKNETVLLKCRNSTESCFSVYSADGEHKEVCPRKLGDYGRGIKTPEHFTILFRSYFCLPSKSPVEMKENEDFRKSFRFNPEIRSCYKIYTPEQEQNISPYSCINRHIYESCVHQIDGTNCTGIKTQNNETIVISCSYNDAPHTGCFKIYTSRNEEHTACQTEIEERCVGFKTPSNLTVLLECTFCSKNLGNLPPYYDEERKEYRRFVQNAMKLYQQGNFSFRREQALKIYKPNQNILLIDCYGTITQYYVHELHGHENCLGVTTENLETIVLQCPNKTSNNPECFEIYTPKYGPKGEVSGPKQEVNLACLQVLEEKCVGIVTPSNWILPLACYQPRKGVCSTINVPYNGPPPRM